jgi:hypothetical protein
MFTVLDHLPHSGDPSGPQELSKLAEVIRLVVGERRDQIRALTGASWTPLSVK